MHQAGAPTKPLRLVHLFLGTVLIIAGALKLAEFATETKDESATALFIMVFAEAEVIGGLWMAAGINPVASHPWAAAAFGGFAATNLVQGLFGECSRGCFGSDAIGPSGPTDRTGACCTCHRVRGLASVGTCECVWYSSCRRQPVARGDPHFPGGIRANCRAHGRGRIVSPSLRPPRPLFRLEIGWGVTRDRRVRRSASRKEEKLAATAPAAQAHDRADSAHVNLVDRAIKTVGV
jgi:hypothetical protein